MAEEFHLLDRLVHVDRLDRVALGANDHGALVGDRRRLGGEGEVGERRPPVTAGAALVGLANLRCHAVRGEVDSLLRIVVPLFGAEQLLARLDCQLGDDVTMWGGLAVEVAKFELGVDHVAGEVIEARQTFGGERAQFVVDVERIAADVELHRSILSIHTGSRLEPTQIGRKNGDDPGARGGNRTPGARLRTAALYPLSYAGACPERRLAQGMPAQDVRERIPAGAGERG